MTWRRLVTMVLALIAVAAAPAAASWTSPVDGLSPLGQNPSAPKVVVGPDGIATAVWPASNGLWASRRAPGGDWSQAVAVPGSGPQTSLPDVAAGPDGTAVAVWHSSFVGNSGVFAARFTGGQWVALPTVVGIIDPMQARVAVDGDGVATVIWHVVDGAPMPKGRIIARRSVGAGWGDPRSVSGDDDAASPQVAAGPGGTAIVVWQAPIQAVSRIRAHRVTNGAWREQIESVSPATDSAGEAAVAMGPDGATTAAWTRTADGGEYVRAARLVGDAWVASGDLSPLGDNASDIGVAAAPGGVAAVAWRRTPVGPGPDFAEVACFDGTNWVPAAQPLSNTALGADTIDVAVGPDGVATVAWVLLGGPKNLAQARRAGPGGLGETHDLDPGFDSEDTRLAAGPDGVVTAVWRSFDPGDSKYDLRSSRFRVPPPAPTGVGAVAGDAQATVSWTPPVLTGDSPITGYLVTATPGGRTCSTTGVLSCTVDGLTNGTPHTFNVRATNAQGTGPASAESAPVTPLAPPAPIPVPVTPLPALTMTGVAVAPRVVVRGRPAQTTRTLVIRATLNREARVRVLFQRRAPGLRRGRNCVAPTAALRRAKARRCVRFLTAGSLTRPGRVGANRIVVTRLKVGRRTLAVGRYRVTVIAAVAGSRPVVVQRPLVVRPAR